MKRRIDDWIEDLYSWKMLLMYAAGIFLYIVVLNLIGAFLVAAPLVLACVAGVFVIKRKVRQWKKKS